MCLHMLLQVFCSPNAAPHCILQYLTDKKVHLVFLEILKKVRAV